MGSAAGGDGGASEEVCRHREAELCGVGCTKATSTRALSRLHSSDDDVAAISNPNPNPEVANSAPIMP
ncbi:hypothetical protein MIMGU_mgv1a022297mg [Erythranthe guttata]|uniref:Uncharacterized protein n=1 Tax=Erythranthe guttata TaxID=4155 RepID=A0A022PXC1_ERYGU|nr:hypothetical protein MIMGU_mgv1a022297mg [Erythranthe guttata]